MSLVVLAVHAFATLYMTGLVWFVQLVHYPLMARVGTVGYDAYQREHQRRTARAVLPAMLTELGLTLWLAWRPPPGVPAEWTLAGVFLLATIWLSTWFLQVPVHRRLERGYDVDAHRRLVRGNWVRTAAWTLRAALAVLLLASARAG